MNSGCPIKAVSASLHDAVFLRRLHPTRGLFKGKEYINFPTDFNTEVVAMFPQTWGSTALGFGGIGGQAVTSAYVVVVQGPCRDCAVYFGSRFAYRIDNPNRKFWEDVAARCMVDVSGGKRAYETDQETKGAK